MRLAFNNEANSSIFRNRCVWLRLAITRRVFLNLFLLGGVGFAAVFGCAGNSSRQKGTLARIEDSIIYQPSVFPKGDWRPADLVFEDVWFTAEDGTSLHGWYCPRENPRAFVLYLHGNAGNLSHRADLLRNLQQRHRLSVFIFDYRGYGRSEGKPDENGVLQDARAARAWLAARAGIDQSQVVLMGRSLGGGVAIDLAANEGARGLILQSTFTSLPDVAASKPIIGSLASVMQGRLNSINKIAAYRGPLLYSHGDADNVIPYAHGLKLFEAANLPKRFVTIPGGNHNDPQTPEYYAELNHFIDQLPVGPTSSAGHRRHSIGQF